LILLVPLLELIRKIRIGEFEAEIQPREVAQAKAKISVDLPPEAPTPDSTEEPYRELTELVHQDPQLGMAKLRIELETWLRRLYRALHDDEPPRRVGMTQLVRTLSEENVLAPEVAAAIRDILPLANRAAHGETVRPQDAEVLARLGVRVLLEIRSSYFESVLAPVEVVPLSADDLNLFLSARYRITTIIPAMENPTLRTRVVDQEGLDELLEGYDEYAEFLVSIEPLSPEASARLLR
jgi:hypothetical protein